MQGSFSIWMGQPVVLQIASGGLRVPVKGKVVAETGDAVRLRMKSGNDIDIHKAKVLAVERENWVCDIT